MVDLIEEAARLQDFLSEQQCQFCFIGGLAVQQWGEPRLTRDIDLTLMTGFGGEAEIVDRILSVYAGRISNTRDFALANRVLLLRTPAGTGIDIALAALPFEAAMIDRSMLVELLPGRALRLCTPEDLIVMKVFAGRETDLRDARSVVVRRRPARLDWAYIEENVRDLSQLAADERSLRDLERLRDSHR